MKMPKEFRYELGARVRNYATDIAEALHFCASAQQAREKHESLIFCGSLAHKLRLDLRLLKDLCQIGIKQWGFLNLQIENLLNSLRAEFCNANTRIARATHSSQSSSPLPPAFMQESM
jgi:hypothetical protein